ncbi:MAG: hypothetical protein AB7T06_07145 [Kofleriaceae bacterium]
MSGGKTEDKPVKVIHDGFWAVHEAYSSLHTHLDEVRQFAEVTMRGLVALKDKRTDTGEAMSALGRLLLANPGWDKDAEGTTAIAPAPARDADTKTFMDALGGRKDKEFVEKQEKAGFSPVYAQACISAWGFLESTVDDMLVALIANDCTFLMLEDVAKIKISIGQYETTTVTERVEFLVDSIQQSLNSKFKRGIQQFESVFEKLSLDGPLVEDLARTFIEFAAVRNALVHRRGRADRRFLEACPWLGLGIGDPVVVTEVMHRQYSAAAIAYAALIQERTAKRYAIDDDRLVKLVDRMTKTALNYFEHARKERGWKKA